MERQVQVMGKPLIPAEADTQLQEIFRLQQAMNERFYNGDPALDGWADDSDVTIHGGFDVSARGWAALERGLPRAASRLSDGEMTFTPLGGRVVGDMAYIAGFEEGKVRLEGGEKKPMKLRVTMVMLRLEGQWKAVHRHGEIVLSP